MSMTSSLANALSGLNVAGRRAEIVSQNIANAQTDGYGSRDVAISSSWSGVKVDGILRNVDRGLLNDRRLAESQLKADTRSANFFEKIETIIGIPGDENTIAGRISSFEAALVTASHDPASEQRLGAVNDALRATLNAFDDASRSLQTLRRDADAQINDDVQTLNTSLKQVEKLNADIGRMRIAGQDTSSLFDVRQQIIDTIGGIVPIRELDRGHDQIGLMTTSGMVLLDGRASQFEFSRTPTIVADMTMQTGGVSGITLNGVPVDPVDGFGKLGGGSLAASFAQRDTALVNAQRNLDEIAYRFASRFADVGVDPTFTTMGLITDAGAPLDGSDIVGLSTRLDIHASVDIAQGGLLSRWRDGVGAITAGPVGDNAQLDRWRTALSSGGIGSVSEDIAALASEVGRQRLAAQSELSFSAARWDSLHAAELSNGVDSDAELQKLLLIEQAYAANAKVIQTVNAMLQQIMEI